jgi:hypothetical protein
MPNSNAFISTFVRLEQSLDRALEMLRTGESISVELDDERRVQLDPADPRSSGFARVLDGLSTQMLPVYLEIDPASDAITRLLIPYIARVTGIGYSAEGALNVTLDASHAVHVLRLDGPDFAELERELRGALGAAQPVIVVDDDAHHIIDIRAFTPDPDKPRRPLPPFPPTPIPDRNLFQRLWERIWWWIFWPWWWWFRCVSMKTAQQLFNAMAATTCDPLTIPPPCIPFLYPDDGCWARAHEMCRLMINSGLHPRKVWIYGSLYVNTKNNPRCFVRWGWHVAPTLCVRVPIFFPFLLLRTRRMVIDPSLFTSPVTEATWKGVQGDPTAVLTHTSADQFWPGGGTDPTYSGTNHYLGVYRLELQLRSIQQGPPPYAVCP